MLYSQAKENNFSFFTVDAEVGYRPFSNFSISPLIDVSKNIEELLDATCKAGLVGKKFGREKIIPTTNTVEIKKFCQILKRFTVSQYY